MQGRRIFPRAKLERADDKAGVRRSYLFLWHRERSRRGLPELFVKRVGDLERQGQDRQVGTEPAIGRLPAEEPLDRIQREERRFRSEFELERHFMEPGLITRCAGGAE